MDLSEDDVRKILRVLDELEYGEVRLEVGDLKLHLRKDAPGTISHVTKPESTGTAGPTVHQESDCPVTPEPAGRDVPAETATLRLIRAPMAGVFYRAPGPGQGPFVRVGQTVAAGDTVCLLEIMKLYQSVTAGIAGRVSGVFVEDGESVIEGQALVAIETAE
jgi:acetyl-CoA carboxylase biotin carboxyl carrier protein